MKFTAIFEKFPEGYAAFVEELPGANTQGATLEEARRQLETQAEEVSRTLSGLIRAVENEAGALRRSAAKITSLVVLALRSAVFRLRQGSVGQAGLRSEGCRWTRMRKGLPSGADQYPTRHSALLTARTLGSLTA